MPIEYVKFEVSAGQKMMWESSIVKIELVVDNDEIGHFTDGVRLYGIVLPDIDDDQPRVMSEFANEVVRSGGRRVFVVEDQAGIDMMTTGARRMLGRV